MKNMFRLNLKKITELFSDNNISVNVKELETVFITENFPLEIRKYLSLMNSPVSIHQSEYGVSLTYLMSQQQIADEYQYQNNKHCIANGYLMIGSGPNGDRLCINLQSGLVGYVFSDDLWEENFNDFSDIYVELPFSLDEFLETAFKSKDYIYDGDKAEEYMKSLE